MKVIIFSAPSGAGKTTIVRHLLSNPKLALEFSVSACTREPRPHEVDGKDYYFMTLEKFKKHLHDKDFLEYEEVYKDIFYGTLKSEVQRIHDDNKFVIFDVDVKGGLNIKKYFGENALAIFVKPPSLEVLQKRLLQRSTESEEKLKMRLGKAVYEMKYEPFFDKVLVNDNLDHALEEAEKMVSQFLGL
ncbi:MAG: guanylate kinase [Bacteroidetes bacterium]|nr:guanylate kinase [Bacteroidota bacterium]